MKITLYTQPKCPECTTTKTLLKKDGIDFEEKSLITGMDEMRDAVQECGIEPSYIKSAPVMVVNGSVFTGADCSIAVEYREWGEEETNNG